MTPTNPASKFPHDPRLLDTRENDSHIELANVLLKDVGGRVEALESYLEEARTSPAVGSKLARADELTPYNPLSFQVRSCLSVGVDSIRMVCRFIEVAKELPMLAHYAPLRVAVESTSLGVWLLGSGTKQKSAWQSLRLSYRNNEDLEGLESVFEAANENRPDREWVRERLRGLQAALPDYRNHDITKFPNNTDLVIDADRRIASKRMASNGLQVWKSCSGVAHANDDVIRTLLERVPIERTDRGYIFHMTSRMLLTAAFAITAVENAEVLRDQIEEASAPAESTSGAHRDGGKVRSPLAQESGQSSGSPT